MQNNTNKSSIKKLKEITIPTSHSNTEEAQECQKEYLVVADNIYKNFGALKVLKGSTAKITKGEKVFIIGPSGSGKSTLLRCMNLLETPTFGEVWLDNKLLTPVDPYLHPQIIEKSLTFKKLLISSIF